MVDTIELNRSRVETRGGTSEGGTLDSISGSKDEK